MPQDTLAMDAARASVRSEIDELQTALGAELASVQAAQVNTSVAVADSVNSTNDANEALLQRIDLLLQQQIERDKAIVEALKAISDNTRGSAE